MPLFASVCISVVSYERGQNAPTIFIRKFLFLSFKNDIDDILFGTSLCMKLFADDVKLCSSFTHSLHDLQFVCDRLATWAEKWQLRIAFDKCSVHRIS